MDGLRRPTEGEIEHLARLWHNAWHEAHAAHVPAALTRLRTPESFAVRMAEMLDRTRTIGDRGPPQGFCTIRDDELMHLFVAPSARGGTLASDLLLDGERRLARAGTRVAWLVCVVGNDRAARFYEKHGWTKIGLMLNHVETSDGPFALEEWRYEKFLTPNVDG